MLGAVAFLVLFLVPFLVSTPAFVQPASSKLHFVRGTVVVPVVSMHTPVVAAPRAKEIALPHARVFLVRPNALTTPIASALSDLSGRFLIKTDQSGVFTLCVEADGFKRTCASKEFRFERPAHWYGHLSLPIPVGSDLHAAGYGTVTLQDGKLARGFEPFMDVNAYARIDMSASSGARHRAYVNNFGEYVIPQIPIKEDFVLRASIDGHAIERPIKTLTNLSAGRVYPFDFVFPDPAPRIRVISATSAGKPVQIAMPGSTITLHAVAEDPHSHKLQYRWLLPDGTMVGPTNDPELQWKVPSQRGKFAISALVSNQRGGYARSGIVITAATTGAPFNGIVVDTFGQPVAGALVDVNGRLINANTQGRFSFAVPIADRYVMTIRSPGIETPNQRGFGTASFIYKASITGGRWVLRRAEVTTVDSTQPIVLEHRRDRRDCAGMIASRIDWSNYLQPEAFQWQDGRGNIVALPDLAARDPRSVQNAMRMISWINPALVKPFAEAAKTRPQIAEGRLPCKSGIKVEIPANALIDPSTNSPPTGPVQVALSTVDLTASNQMPGDYSADDGSGKIFAMESFGAGSVEIGAGTSRYQLRRGATATVTIPVDITQIAGGAHLDTKIPFLYYDERQGIWRQDGDATLTGSGVSAAYVKTVTRFSAMNADILKSGQSCVAVEVDPAAGFSLPFDAEVVMQPSVVNPNVIQVRTLTVDTTRTNVIYNLPNNSDIVLTPIIQGVLPDGSTGNVPAGVFVVNTGGPQTAAITPPPPNPDGTYYAESGGQPTGPCAPHGSRSPSSHR
ncbi:carboxypeptidase-like regulatory domain-containing protein [Bradyrhizobium sp. TZ2]